MLSFITHQPHSRSYYALPLLHHKPKISLVSTCICSMCVFVCIVCWPDCHFMLVALGESITLIAVWQSVFMTGNHGALPSMAEKHIDPSPGDLRWLSNLALCTDGHVECSSAEPGIDCVEVNGRVIFFCVHLAQPSCHPFFPVISSYNSLAVLQNPLLCVCLFLFRMSWQLWAAQSTSFLSSHPYNSTIPHWSYHMLLLVPF